MTAALLLVLVLVLLVSLALGVSEGVSEGVSKGVGEGVSEVVSERVSAEGTAATPSLPHSLYSEPAPFPLQLPPSPTVPLTHSLAVCGSGWQQRQRSLHEPVAKALAAAPPDQVSECVRE